MHYNILVFTVLKEQRMASSQKICKGPKCHCFTFIKGQLRQLFIFQNEPTCIIDTLAQRWPVQEVNKEFDFSWKEKSKKILKSSEEEEAKLGLNRQN